MFHLRSGEVCVVAARSSKLPDDDDCMCGMHATRAFAALSLFLSNSTSLE